MDKELFQKTRFGNYRKHILTDDTVSVEYRTVKNIVRYDVNIFELGSTRQYERGNRRPARRLALICALLPLAFLASDLLAHRADRTSLLLLFLGYWAFAAYLFLKPVRDDLFLTGGKMNLVFYRAIPDEDTVLEFIQAIKANRDRILKKNLIRYDDDTSESEYAQRLDFLRSSGIITANDHENYLDNFRLSRLL